MEDLPNELLLYIFSFLHTPITCFSSPHATDRSRDLVVLCRVCRRFKDVATPLVYESIERTGDMNSLVFRQLPRTLFNNMELCRYIKNVRLKMDDSFEMGDIFGVQDLLHEDGYQDKNEEGRETDAESHQRRH